MKKQKQLDLLEAALVSTGHRVRYEKGSFIGGDCRVKENMIVVVNKFLPIEGKIATLASVLRKINLPRLSPEVVKIIDTLVATDLFSRDNG